MGHNCNANNSFNLGGAGGEMSLRSFLYRRIIIFVLVAELKKGKIKIKQVFFKMIILVMETCILWDRE
jgi:hypothetical protein